MQARLVELLLRYDAPRLAAHFDERPSGPLGDPRLARYRELAALWHLRGELFESVLPRVKRRLSFAAPRELRVEPLPPRGRVDWPQTAAASLRERPGQPPLVAHTRQRRRSFGTPENLLVAVTLIEYRQAAEQILAGELVSGGPTALRHPLHDIVVACERELAFPPLAGLIPEAERIVAGEGEHTPDDLQRLVTEQLPPGRTSAYDDLLAWRERLASLQLAADDGAPDAPPALGADPAQDDLLYHAWLFYELADLLRRRGRLVAIEGESLSFTWGDEGEPRRYVLRHRPELPGRWKNGPSTQPGLSIEREGRACVRNGEKLIWQEPGYVVAAAFAPMGADDEVRRLLGDLQLAGERRGAFVYACGYHNSVSSPIVPYVIAPAEGLDVPAPDAVVTVSQIAPIPGEEQGPQSALEWLLDDAHTAIGPPLPITCHGVFLDTLSAAERETLTGRDGRALRADPSELLICPKPHVGPWRIDLVSREQHCCRDPRLCHIIGQPGARPPVRPPRTTEDLLRELGRLFETRSLDALDEEIVDAVARRVEAITRRFAEVAGDFGDVTVYERRLRDAGMDRTLHLLGANERESLALAVYLVDKLDRVRASDFSAPTIHIARVLEREIQRRVMAIPGITPADFPHGKPTLGALAGTRRKRPEVWAKIEAHLASVWDGHVDEADPAFVLTFDGFVQLLQPIVYARNQAAHTTPVGRQRYSDIFRDVCRGGTSRVGVLNALLLAWQSVA